MEDLKKGTHIRFKVVNYTADYERECVVGIDEDLAGKVVAREGDGYAVRVNGYKLPFYVRPEDILGEEA